MANICVTGIWHQGTVVSACLADLGNIVCGVCDEKIAEILNDGRSPVFEPELPDIIQHNLDSGRLSYTSDYDKGLQEAEFVYLSTDTHVDENDDSDLVDIYSIAENIGRNLKSNVILIITAQVPIGTSEDLAKVVHRFAPTYECKFAYIPEFLRLGTAVHTFRQADRFVIGCDDPKVAERVAALYQPLRRPILFTDVRSAEMAKHASNAYLSTSISFINEIANLCEVLDADALEVSRILKLDQRIGKHAFLSPGLGFAGGTLGREIRALQKLGIAHEISTPLMDAVWQVNAQRSQLVSRRLSTALKTLNERQIGILGLTYKAGTSSIRRAISLDIAHDLVQQGAHLKVFDPLANIDEVTDLPPMQFCSDPYEAAEGSDALVLVTEWAEINDLDLARLHVYIFVDGSAQDETAIIRII